MAGQQIKEYVIKITANVQDAQQQINALAKDAAKIDNLKNFDQALQRQTDSVTKSIETISKELGELKSAFKNGIDVAPLTKEIQSLSDALDSSIKTMTESINGFRDSFATLNNTGGGGFNEVFTNLAKQVKSMVTSYKEMGQVLQGAMSGQIQLPQLDMSQVAKQTQSDAQKAEEELNKAKEKIQKAVQAYNDAIEDIKIASTHAGYETSSGDWVYQKEEELRQVEKIVGDLLSLIQKAEQIDGIDLNELIYDKINISKSGLIDRRKKIITNIQDEIERQQEEIQKKVTGSAKGDGTPTATTTVQIGVEVDPNSVSPSNISAIADQIKSTIIRGVQLRINDNPIKIPVVLSTDKQAQEAAAEEKALEDVKKKKPEKEITNQLILDVKANTDGLVEEINDKIKDINEKITEEIKVKVKPDLMDDNEIHETAMQVEEDIQEAFKRAGKGGGITVDMSGFGSSKIDDEQTHSILNDIRGTVNSILAQMGGKPSSGGFTGGINASRIITTPTPTLPPSGSGSATQPTQVQTKNLNIQADNTVVAPKVAKRQPEGVLAAPSTPVINASRGYNFDNFNKFLMSGRHLKNIPENILRQNLQTESERYAEQVHHEFAKALKGDILSKKVKDVTDIQNRNYMTKQISANGNAWYGGSGQSLPDFQKEVTDFFIETRNTVAAKAEDITKDFADMRTSTELVASGIDDEKVTKWQKELIDYYHHKAESDSKGTAFKSKFNKSKAKNPKIFDQLRAQYIEEEERESAKLQKSMDARAGAIREANSNIGKYKEELKLLSKDDEVGRTALQGLINDNTKLLNDLYKEEEVENQRLQASQTNIKKYQSSSDADILKEYIKRLYNAKASSVKDNAVITKDIEGLLNDIRDEKIKKESSKIVSDAIKQKYGQNVLSEPKDRSVSMIDVKNPYSQKMIRNLEKVGLHVDEKTGSLISFTTPRIDPKWGIEDIQQRLDEVGEVAKNQLVQQQSVTQQLAENENEYKEFVQAYDNIQKGIDVDTNQAVIDRLREQVITQSAYFENADEFNRIIVENSKLEAAKSKGKLSDKDQKKYDDNIARLSQMEANLNGMLENNDTEGNLRAFELVQRQLQRIQESRRKEQQIISQFQSYLASIADNDTTRNMDESTYNKLKFLRTGLVHRRSQLIARAGMKADNSNVAYENLTETERAELFDKINPQLKDINRKIYGYEMGNGMRSFDKNQPLIINTKSANVAKPKLIQMGLTGKTVNEYPTVPALERIREIMTDQYGYPLQSAFGQEEYKLAPGVSIEQAEKYAQILTDAADQMDATLAKIPDTDEAAEAYAQGKLQKDIEYAKRQLEKSQLELQKVDTLITEKKAAGEVTKRLEEITRPYLKSIVDRDEKSLQALTTDNIGIEATEKIRKNEGEIEVLNAKEQELSARFQELSGVSDEAADAIRALGDALRNRNDISNELYGVKKLLDVDKNGVIAKGIREPIKLPSTSEGKNDLDSLESLYRRWTDLDDEVVKLAEREKELKKALPHVVKYDKNNSPYIKLLEPTKDDEFKAYEDYEEARRITSEKRSLANSVYQQISELEKQTLIKGQELKRPSNLKLIDINGNAYKSMEEVESRFKDLESVGAMWDDTVKEAKENLNKLLPPGTAKKIIAQLDTHETNKFGETTAANELTEIADRLLDIREQKELLQGEINKIKLDMERAGQSDKSQRQIRLGHYKNVYQTRRGNIESSKDIARLGVTGITSAIENTKKIQDEQAKVAKEVADKTEENKKKQEEIEAKLAIPANERVAKLRQQSADEIARIDEGLTDSNETLIQTREEIQKRFTEKNDALSAAMENLTKAQEKYTSEQKTPQQIEKEYAERVVAFMESQSPGYNKASEDKQREIIDKMYDNITGNVYNSLDALQDAVESGMSKDITKPLAKNLLQAYGQLDLFRKAPRPRGAIAFDLSDEGMFGAEYSKINGENPIEYAKGLVGEEVSEKERVVELAKQEVEAAQKEFNIAQQASQYISGKGVIDKNNITDPLLARYVEAQKSIDAKEEAKERKKAIAIRSDEEIDKIIKSGKFKSLNERELELVAARSNDTYKKFLYEQAGIPIEVEKKYNEEAKKANEERLRIQKEQEKIEAQEKNRKTDSDIARLQEGRGQIAKETYIDPKQQQREIKDATKNAEKQMIVELKKEWRYADMNADQREIAQKISRLVYTKLNSKRGLTDQENAQLEYLHNRAKENGLELKKNGYVKELVSWDEYKQNPQAHPTFHFTDLEKERRGLLSARENRDRVFDQMAQSVAQDQQQLIDEQQAIDETDRMIAQLHAETDSGVQSNQEFAASMEPVAQGADNATSALDRFKEAVHAMNLGQYKGTDIGERIKSEYSSYIDKIKNNKIMPEYALSEFKKTVQALTASPEDKALHDAVVNGQFQATGASVVKPAQDVQQATDGVTTALSNLHDSMIVLESDAAQGSQAVQEEVQTKSSARKTLVQQMDELLSSDATEEAMQKMISRASGYAKRSTTSDATRNEINIRTKMLEERIANPQVQVVPTESGVQQPIVETASQTQAAAEGAAQLADNLQQAQQAATATEQAVEATAQATQNAASNTTALTDSQNNQNAPNLPKEETGAFGQMEGEVESVTKAIAAKNNALTTEASIVNSEIGSFNTILEKVTAIASKAKEVKFEFNLSGANGLDDNFITKFKELITEINGIGDTSKLQAVGDAFKGMKIDKSVGDNFKALGDGIREFSQQLSGDNINGNNFNDLMNLIDRIQDAGEHISKMSDVLKNSAKAGQGIFGMKYSQDMQTETAMQEYMDLMKYLSNPNNIIKAETLKKQVVNYSDLSAKDMVWAQDFDQRYKRAEELKNSLEQTNNLESEAMDLLTKTWNDYQSKAATANLGLDNEINNLVANTQEALDKIAGTDIAKTYTSGFGDLQAAISRANAELQSGEIDAKKYKEVIKSAMSDFDKYAKIERAAFGNNNQVGTILDTSGMGFDQEKAREYVSGYIRDNYKKVISDVTTNTKIVDGSEVSVFKAQVEDANGMVQRLTLSWSDVTDQIRMSTAEVQKNQTGLDGMISAITGRVKQLSTYWTAQLFNPYRMIGNIKKVINVVKEYDSAMMEIRKVSNESSEAMRQLNFDAFNMGDQVGSTGKDILSSVAAWKRLGKSFEESQEAAVASNWLLNVSEFTNIDDATKSLVSMTQAFRDLSYESAIDKLNGVGDAFSSSTDQIASGMQNVSSVLQVAGNNVDQSIALLAAANDVTQDMSKASMGVRTIALRIAGTQDAKQQLEDMGEDTSDFVVQTMSKVDQKVRNYTKTSKTPGGISVLDDKGRLRDTYSILLDIAKVWDDIVAKDNKFGTNTSNALLELLAGKTRSNVLASILQAPDILEKAYETSKGSAGIGQRELDIYLDSVVAKTTQLTNKLQELANITINSDGLKVMLDLVNLLMTGVNGLAKAFGSLNLAVGAIASLSMQKRGNGFVNYDKSRGFQFGNIFKGTQNAKQNKPASLSIGERISGKMSAERAYEEGKKSVETAQGGEEASVNIPVTPVVDAKTSENVAEKDIVDSIVETVEDADVGKQVGDVVNDSMEDLDVEFDSSDYYESFTDGANNVVEATEQIAPAAEGAADAINNVGATARTSGQAVNEMSKQIQQGASALSMLKNIGATFLSMMANMVIAAAASWAIGQITKGIYNIINAEKIAIDKGKDARKAISEIGQGFTEKNDFVDKNLESYLKLREGIKQSAQNGIQNVSLTDNEYQEFIAINKELANLFPSLVSGYDSQGNALINLSSDADDATTSLQNLLEQERQIADFKVGEQLGDAITGFAVRYKQLQKDIDKQNTTIEAAQEIQKAIEEKTTGQVDLSKLGVDKESRGINYKFNTEDDTERAVAMKIATAYAKAAEEFGGVEWSGDYLVTGNVLGWLTNITADQLDSFEEAFRAQISEMELADIPEEILDAMSARNIDLSEIKADWNALVPSIISQLNLYDQYQKLGDSKLGNQLQEIMANDISNLHFDEFNTDDWDLFENNPRQFVRERFLDPIVNAVKDEKGNYSDKIISNIIDTIGATDKDLNKWRNDIIMMSLELFDGDAIAAKNFRIALGVQYETKDGRLIWSEDEGISNLSEITEIPKQELNTLDKDDLDLVIEASITGKFDFKGTTLEELQQWIDKYKEAAESAKEIAPDGSLEQIFADEDYSSAAEVYEKRLSALTSALETVRTEGGLTAEQMKDLQEELPNLTDFSEEAIGDAALKELTGWVDEFKKHIDTLSPKGMEQLQTYVENLIMSFGDLDVSAEEAKNTIMESITSSLKADGLTGANLREERDAIYEEQMSKLKDAYGDNLDQDVLLILALEDQFSDPANNIVEAYDHTKINYDVVVNANKAISELESIRSFNAARQSRDGNMTAADYEADNEIAKGLIEQYQIRLSNAVSDIGRRTWGAKILEEQQKIKENNKAAAELPLTFYENQYNLVKNTAEEMQRVLDDTSKIKTADMYTNLSANGDAQIAILERWASTLEKLRDDADSTDDWFTYNDQLKSVNDNIISIRNNQKEWDKQIRELPLTNLQNQYTDLQSKAAVTEEALNTADAKHQKTSERLYRTLIKNGDEQIENLKKQRSELVTLRNATQRGSDDWRDYQNQINDVDSSISSMQQNQLGWFETMSSLVSTNASELSSALSSAFQEMNSETGLTIDTMNELKRQFSDLAGVDVSTIFYQSADGMKMNVGAAEELVDAEYQLQQTQLDSIIAQQRKILADDNATAAAKRNAQERINEAQRELSMLQALYDQQKQQFSNFAKWQNAQSTENAGANYESLYGYLKTQKESYEKGLTGTDEFRAYTEYFDRWGRDTVDAWEDVQSKVERYMTEDSSGLKHFMDDLVANGFAEVGENGGYLINMPSVEEAAQTLGMNVEWIRDLLGRSEDYGFTNNWVESELDGRMKIQDETQKLIEAQEKYNQAVADGASQDVLDDLESVINTHKNNIEGLGQGIEDVTAHEGEISRSQIELARSNIESFSKLIAEQKENGTLTEEMRESFEQQMQRWADQNYIKLKVGAEGELEIDEDAFKETFPEFEVDVKVNPIVSANADISNLKTNGNETHDNIIQQLESAYDETDGFSQDISDILSMLDNYTGEDLDKIVFGDGIYQNEELESALDSLLGKLGLGQEAGNELISVLKELFGIKSESDYFETPKVVNEPEVVGKANMTGTGYEAAAREYDKYNTQIQEEWSEHEQEQGPTISAIDQVSAAVETHSGEIVSAIEALPAGIASALNGDTNTNEQDASTELAKDILSKVNPSENVLNNDTSKQLPTKEEIAKEILDMASPLENVSTYSKQEVKPEEPKIVIPLDEMAIAGGGQDYGETIGGMLFDAAKTVLNSAVDAVTSPTMRQDNYSDYTAETTSSVPKQIEIDESAVQVTYESNPSDMTETVSQDVSTGQATADGQPIEPQYDGGGDGLLGMVADAITSASFVAEENPIEINYTSGDTTTSQEQPQSDVIVTPQVDNGEYESAMSSAIETADELNAKKPTPKADLDTSQYDAGSSSVKSDMTTLGSLTATPTVNVGPSVASLAELTRAAQEAALAVASVGGGGGSKMVQKYTGTMIAPAHASGTAYNMLNLRRITGAFADGKVGLDHDEEALVNELGTESLIRDGQWYLIPGGMHVEALKKGDIVLNHLQTQDLVQHGKAFGRGKAFAQGSGIQLAPIGPAHGTVEGAGGGQTKANSVRNSGSITSGGNPVPYVKDFTKATEKATDSTKSSTKAKDKETKATEGATTALEKFQNWANSFMDWIEVRIKRITNRMELALSKAENIGGAQTYKGMTGYAGKNAYIDEAMQENANLQSTYEKAIGTNSKGKKRGYTKHLSEVVNKAKSSKLITAKEAKRLNKLIQEGGLTVEDFSKYLKNKKTSKGKDSSKTENRATAYIQEYEKWYEKILDCENGIQECIAKNKELQQQKLDNIVEEYESLTSYVESLSATSQAMISLHEATGYSESYGTQQGAETRQEYHKQIANQRSISLILLDEMDAYYTELQKAATIYGVNSKEYNDALTTYEGMKKAFKESETNVKELTRALYDLNLKPMEYALNRLQALATRFQDVVSLKQARGTMYNDPSSILTEANYTDQLLNANDQIAKLTERMEYNKRIQGDLDYATDSAKWDELQKAIDADEHSIYQLMITNEQLKDSIRELRWKPFKDLQKQLNNNVADFEHLRSLFNEEEFFDDDGEGWNFTTEGLDNIALIGAEMMNTRNNIAICREALTKLNEEYENGLISLEEYEEESRNMVETIQDLVKNNENYKDSLVDLWTKQVQNEEAALQKIISARKEALSQKKAYYDYDKTLKSANKELNLLKAQSAALQGVTNATAKAQKARLDAQIKEKEEDLADTRYNHRYDILSQGYDKLAEDSQEALDKALRHVQANAAAQEEIVEQMLNHIKDNYDDVYESIQQRIAETGTVVGQTAQDCLDSPQLKEFFDTISTDTLIPKDNWEEFTDAVAKDIDTTAIKKFYEEVDKLLDAAIAKAKETANALANAAQGQSQTSTDEMTLPPTQPSTEPEQQQQQQQTTTPAKETDEVVKILKNLKKGKSKTGGKVGNWVYETFGKSTEHGDPTKLAKALHVSVNRTWTSQDDENVLKALKKHLKNLKITNLKTLNAYRSGTLGTRSDELAWTHEGEIIRRSDGAILRQLPAGTQVIPKVASENLLKWAQIDPFKELKEGFANTSSIMNNNNAAPIIYYDSIIHVDGNVDADMMDRISDIANGLLKDRNFMQKQFDFNTQNFKRAYNKRA